MTTITREYGLRSLTREPSAEQIVGSQIISAVAIGSGIAMDVTLSPGWRILSKTLLDLGARIGGELLISKYKSPPELLFKATLVGASRSIVYDLAGPYGCLVGGAVECAEKYVMGETPTARTFFAGTAAGLASLGVRSSFQQLGLIKNDLLTDRIYIVALEGALSGSAGQAIRNGVNGRPLQEGAMSAAFMGGLISGIHHAAALTRAMLRDDKFNWDKKVANDTLASNQKELTRCKNTLIDRKQDLESKKEDLNQAKEVANEAKNELIDVIDKLRTGHQILNQSDHNSDWSNESSEKIAHEILENKALFNFYRKGNNHKLDTEKAQSAYDTLNSEEKKLEHCERLYRLAKDNVDFRQKVFNTSLKEKNELIQNHEKYISSLTTQAPFPQRDYGTSPVKPSAESLEKQVQDNRQVLSDRIRALEARNRASEEKVQTLETSLQTAADEAIRAKEALANFKGTRAALRKALFGKNDTTPADGAKSPLSSTSDL